MYRNALALAMAMAMAAMLLPALPALAAPALADSVRRNVEARVAKGELASVVIALANGSDGGDAAIAGFGTVGGKAPDGQTIYEIGSATKTFTALLLAQAVTSGRAALHEPVARLLPDYAIPGGITLLDLATHSSGLPRLPSNLAFTQLDNPYAGYGAAQLRSFLASHTLARAPGAAYEYSNTGYGLLGTALAARAGRPYAELVREQITQPLGMNDTAIALTPAMRSRLAPGHAAGGATAANWDFDALAGTGALRSSASDMLRYLYAMMQAAPGSAWALAQTPQRPAAGGGRIGLGWHVNQVQDRTVVWHNGMTGGYASFIGFTSDGQRGVVVLANTAASVDAIGMAALLRP